MFNPYGQDSTESEDDSIPAYMIAANNHNVGNMNPSLTDDVAYNDKYGNVVQRAGKMIASAALSGINSFYNTAVWAGNLFSDKDAQYRDTRDWITSFDDNLGDYYQDNRQSADLLGFVATSFVPGLGGVKVFNAGLKALNLAKEGAVGANMATGLGILPGSRAALVKTAQSSYDLSRQAFSLADAGTLKAVAAGFGEQALQAAAFETAVAVTMKKSPLLQDADVGDILSNIAHGALVGGAIGGVFEAAKTVSTLKKGIKATDLKLAGVTQDLQGVAGTKASDNLLIRRNDLDTLPQNAPEGVDPALYNRLWEQKITRIDEANRADFTKIANGNADLGNRLYEGLRTDSTGNYSAKLVGLEEIGTQADTARLVKKYGIDPEATDNRYAVRHFKLWGDDMGKLSDEAPAALHLADYTKDGVEVRAGKVMAGDFTHQINPGEYWSTANASYKDALARNIWAMDDTVPALALKKDQKFLSIGDQDIPMLTKAYREGFTDFRLLTEKGDNLSPPADLLGYLKNLKDNLAADEYAKAARGGKELPADWIANKYDTPLGFYTGEQYSTNTADAIFGLQKAQKDYWNKFVANTPSPADVSSVKPWLKQQNYKMVYDTGTFNKLDNFISDAIVDIRQRQIVQQATNDMAVASALGDRADMLGEFNDQMLQRVNRGGAGAGFASFANAAYGSAGSLAERTGALVTKWIGDARTAIDNTFMTSNYAVANSGEDAARIAAIIQKARGAGSNVYVGEDGGLVLRSVKNYEKALEAGEEVTAPIIPPGVDERIPYGSETVEKWMKDHIAVNGARSDKLNTLRGAKGQPDSLDPEAFYPPAPNPDRFKFHAFALDDAKINSQGHSTMLYADSAQALEKQIAEARAQGFSVYTPDQTAAYFKARGMYDYTKGLNESQMDAAMQRTGASAPAFPLTGEPREMLQDIMDWHAKQEAIVIREAVSTKYSRQFGTLKQMGDEYKSVADATFGFKGRFANAPENPYEDYIKTFLGASLKQDYPLWTALNNFVNEAGSKVYNAVSSIVGKSKSAYDLEEVNKIFDDYGIKMAATPAQMEAWVNHPAGQNAVQSFIRTQNSILSSLVLRLDPVNSLNNAIGSTILTGAETKSVLRAIAEKNADAVGDLSKLSSVVVPGSEDTITSASKLIAGAYKNFFQDDGVLMGTYKAKGWVTDLSTQFKQLLEDAAIKGDETAAQLQSKTAKMYATFNKLADKGEKWTGNKLAEEMNRFVSANIMDTLTSRAVAEGVMDKSVADSYINTFVNRTQGNMIASQRPQLFQGPIGQAIGLFQTYQFNIMQQLLRYVGEGSKKDAMTLLGLQSTMYGMNGLPGFSAINQHIIGTASGNTSHTDAYNSVNNLVGKNAGDWITYGVASNMFLDPDLKINLYSRGDINPRQVTVVPTNMADIPIVSSWAKLVGSVKGALGSIANGGDVWQSILGGIEQNGISRPLSGIARVARGFDGGVSYSTSSKGNVTSANDLYSLANLARITGAKPFDEAVTQDAVYRIQAYSAVDNQRRETLGTAVKSAVANGDVPTSEQMNKFMEGYASTGGKQEEFTKWYVGQLRQATTPQANKIIQNTKSPYAAYMQSIMGGRMMATPPDILARDQPQEAQ